MTEATASRPGTKDAKGVTEVVAPSGVHIYYQAEPRGYWIKPADPKEGWVEVPSPTTILDVLQKGGLSWWGMKVGVEGVLHLLERQIMVEEMSVDAIVEELKLSKKTVNHVRDQAGSRGTNVHDAFETWANTGKLPDPSFFPPSEEGYVRALVQFIKDTNIKPIQAEVQVASMQHGYAGRFDLLCFVPASSKAVVKTYPKRADLVDVLEPGKWIIDLKTSKSTYSSHHLQLASYNQAAIECGHIEGPVPMGILRVTDDGRYELKRGVGTIEGFLAVKQAWHAVKAIEQEMKK